MWHLPAWRYGQRFGANAAGGFSDILIGGGDSAVSIAPGPSLLLSGHRGSAFTACARVRRALCLPRRQRTSTDQFLEHRRGYRSHRAVDGILPRIESRHRNGICHIRHQHLRTRDRRDGAGVHSSPLHAQSQAIEVGANCTTLGITPDLLAKPASGEIA